MLLGCNTELVGKGVMPDLIGKEGSESSPILDTGLKPAFCLTHLFHIFPAGDNTVLYRVSDAQVTRLALGRSADLRKKRGGKSTSPTAHTNESEVSSPWEWTTCCVHRTPSPPRWYSRF